MTSTAACRRIAACCIAGVAWWLPHASRVAWADETRAHVRPVAEARGLVVALVDTSAAARTPVATRRPVTAGRPTACPPGRVYWRRGGGPPPPCGSPQWVPLAGADETRGLRCRSALAGLNARGHAVVARLRQWDRQARQWAPPAPGARDALECVDDSGVHGAVAGAWHAADGMAHPWSRNAHEEIAWDEDAAAYTLYASDFVAAWHAPARARSSAWDVARGALARLDGGGDYDLALMRHSWNGDGDRDTDAEGGMVVAAAGARLPSSIADVLAPPAPGGGAPWTETLYEAARQLRGEQVDFGRGAHAAPGIPLPSVPASRAAVDPSRYAQPWPHACTRGHALVLAAGGASHDGSGRARALGLPGFGGGERCTGDAAAPCLPALLRYLAAEDLSPLLGTQRLTVDWVELHAAAPDMAAASPAGRWALAPDDRADATALLVEWLARTSYAAHGTAVSADASPQLTSVASAPGLAIAGGFIPGRDDRWLGTLAALARTPSGTVIPGGGFQPAPPARRRLYTDLAGSELHSPANAVSAANVALTAAALGLAPGETARRERTLAWARGSDTEDVDADGDRAEARGDLGAITGGSVAVVHHASGTRVYAGTGDGMLHAFAPAGDEHWAFIPAAFLAHLDELRLGRANGTRHAGLDAELRTLVVDADGDGLVTAGSGDRAVLYFGLRRGGRAYLALDVTEPDAPRRLWTLTPRELPALAQTWATPVPARLTVAGARQNVEHRVVLLAGGHDPTQDLPHPRGRDRIGAALYLVDAYTGALLWHASGRAADSPDLLVESLDYALAATPRALDLDEDGELDRAYVADTGGRVFRFDFHRDAPPAALASAALIADVGGTGDDDRRFYAEPDVAVVRPPHAAPYLAVTLGSGFAPDPTVRLVADRLYSFRDGLGPALPARPLTDAALADAAAGAVRPDAPGWKLALAASGEKIVAGARTIDHRVYVPAYTPPALDVGPDCSARTGSSRLYVLDVRDARRSTAYPSAEPADRDADRDAPARTAGVAPALVVVALAMQDCHGDCPREVVGLLGTQRVDLRWPGGVVRTGFAQRGIE